MRRFRVTSFRRFLLSAVLWGLCQFPSAVAADELVFVNDEAPYCPYAICDHGKDGFVIEIVKAIYSAKGYSVTIKNVPWNRALWLVNQGEADAALDVLRESAPNLLYPKTEVAQFNPVVFVLKTNPWRYEGVDSFRSVRLGLIQGYGYGDERPDFAKYLASNPRKIDWVTGQNPLLRIFKMIELGRLDATMEDLVVANFVLMQAGMQEKFKVAGQFGRTKVNAFVAFNPNKPNAQQLADMFDQGISELRRSGKLQAILATYGMKDWVKPSAR